MPFLCIGGSRKWLILASVLFLKITGMFHMISDSFIGSGMVKNIYLDTKIMTLSPLES